MITPELIGYIRGEFAKGRTREEIRRSLEAEGGWGEADLAEAFRIVIPMQGFGESPAGEEAKSLSVSSPFFNFSSLLKISLVVVVVLALGFGVWFYRTSFLGVWNSGVAKVKVASASLFSRFNRSAEPADTKEVAPAVAAVPVYAGPKDCAAGAMPDLKNPATYQNNSVFSCLGAAALRCEEAKAVLSGPIFPTIFQITKNNNQSCGFKLSYAADSALADASGKKLAGQYISCPLSAVKAIDETKNPPLVGAPSTGNAGKYAAEVYFYGTLGIFVESNLDKSKILSLGCSGPYIDSIISSYRKTQAGNQ